MKPFDPRLDEHVTAKCNPYYTSGIHLRAKHLQTRTISGRTFRNWALSLLPLTVPERILDAGCGWGRFSWELIDSFGVDAQRLVLSDLSPGMLRTASEEARHRAPVRFCVSNVAHLPFKDRSFGGAMANQVLYHLPDIPSGIRELARVLQPDGWLLVTTNSERLRPLIIDLHYRALDEAGVSYSAEEPSPFSTENGEQYLCAEFGNVEKFYFEDESLFESAEELLEMYLTIGRYRNLLARSDVDEATKKAVPGVVRRLAENIINAKGELRAPIIMGAFVCRSPQSC